MSEPRVSQADMNAVFPHEKIAPPTIEELKPFYPETHRGMRWEDIDPTNRSAILLQWESKQSSIDFGKRLLEDEKRHAEFKAERVAAEQRKLEKEKMKFAAKGLERESSEQWRAQQAEQHQNKLAQRQREKDQKNLLDAGDEVTKIFAAILKLSTLMASMPTEAKQSLGVDLVIERTNRLKNLL